mmetsp:Transcript_1002/g.3094  ORF Transcript_1002/g.3094 Transcript_1002/m.3094 type:complete len:295 (+) Transcript_1002:69-953(+)
MADADTQLATLAQVDGTIAAVDAPVWLVLLLSWGAPICSVALTLAGLSTLVRIRQQRSVGQLSIVPFLSLLLNCATWSLYGVLQQDFTVLVPNLLGAILGALYSTQYVHFAGNPALDALSSGASSTAATAASSLESPAMSTSSSLSAGIANGSVSSSPASLLHAQTRARRHLLLTLLMLIGVCMLPVWLGAEAGAYLVGRVGALLATLLLASPLISLRQVLRDRHTGSMPALPTSLASFACAASWAAYGYLVAHDLNIVLPNLIGLLAATFQLVLFATFPSTPPENLYKHRVWA